MNYLALKLILVGVLSVLMTGCQRTQQQMVVQPTATPVVQKMTTTNDDLTDFVKLKMETVCKSDPTKFDITIEQTETDYAWGNGSCEKPGAGFYWGAAKTDGTWSYFMSGNGIPDCKEIEIFPATALKGKFQKCLSNGELTERK